MLHVIVYSLSCQIRLVHGGYIHEIVNWEAHFHRDDDRFVDVGIGVPMGTLFSDKPMRCP
jgi:hypothetical protein